jgi:hypothetical protein
MAPNLARRCCTQRFSRAGQRLVKQRDAECHPYHAPTNLDENYFRFSASEPESSSPQSVRALRDRSRDICCMRQVCVKWWTPTRLAP